MEKYEKPLDMEWTPHGMLSFNKAHLEYGEGGACDAISYFGKDRHSGRRDRSGL